VAGVADFIVSPPEPTDWKLTPDGLADLILSRWPDAEVGRREFPASHEALAFRLRVAENEIEGWLADSGQSLHLDAAAVEDVARFVLWLRTQVPPEQPLLLYDQGFSSQVPLAGDEALTERDLVKRFEAGAV
jgi:hypothetical protein